MVAHHTHITWNMFCISTLKLYKYTRIESETYCVTLVTENGYYFESSEKWV